MTRISLIRHGEAHGNLSNTLDPGAESELTNNGISAARRLLGSFSLDSKVLSSPFKRAYQTASIVFPEAEVLIDNRLSEINFGNFSFNDKSQINHSYYLNNKFPCGESYLNVLSRVNILLNELLCEGHDNYCLITHGGVICILLQSIAENFKDFPIYNIDYCGYLTLYENNAIENISGITKKISTK